jgi:hypothetical protein
MMMRPDPTFHASPKLAMEAPPESFAYTLLLSPDFSKPDALAVIDVKPASPTFSQIVHTVTMPHKGDEFHHFGWNACSSALSPLTGATCRRSTSAPTTRWHSRCGRRMIRSESSFLGVVVDTTNLEWWSPDGGDQSG